MWTCAVTTLVGLIAADDPYPTTPAAHITMPWEERTYVDAPQTALVGSDARRTHFRLFSQNILAGSWISVNLGNAHFIEDLTWETRMGRLLSEVWRRKPDIITLQEVEQDAFHKDLLPRAHGLRFDGVFSTKSGQPIGVAIFWRTALFTAHSALHADLADVSQSRWHFEIAFGWSPAQIGRYLRTARRTSLFVVLTPLHADQGERRSLVVGTTHLIGSWQQSPTNIDVQVFQAVRTMEALSTIVDEQKAKFDSVDVLFTGELNTPPHYPAIVVNSLERLLQKTAADSEWHADSQVDEDNRCDGWADTGECHSNPSRVLAICPQSCAVAGITPDERRQLLCGAWVQDSGCTDAVRSKCAGFCGETSAVATAPAWAIVRSPVYELFTTGKLSKDSIFMFALATKACGMDPSSTLPLGMFQASWDASKLVSLHASVLGSEPATCMSETLDYVMFSDGGHLTPRGVLAPPRALGYEDSVRGLGSDHVPLVADFSLSMSVSVS